MDEYIKKDELLTFKADVYDEDGHVLCAVPTGYTVATPPADVIQVRHGRWIDGDKYCPICKKKINLGGLMPMYGQIGNQIIAQTAALI